MKGDYEEFHALRLRENKPNSKPNKAKQSQFQEAAHAPKQLDQAERERQNGCKKAGSLSNDNENGEGGIRTPGRGVNPYDGLANRCLKPLGHLSERSFSNLPYAGKCCKKITLKLHFL